MTIYIDPPEQQLLIDAIAQQMAQRATGQAAEILGLKNTITRYQRVLDAKEEMLEKLRHEEKPRTLTHISEYLQAAGCCGAIHDGNVCTRTEPSHINPVYKDGVLQVGDGADRNRYHTDDVTGKEWTDAKA